MESNAATPTLPPTGFADAAPIKLSRKQKLAMGIVVQKPLSEAQKRRNEMARDALKAYHARRKEDEREQEEKRVKEFEEKNRVVVAAKPEKQVREKKRPPPSASRNQPPASALRGQPSATPPPSSDDDSSSDDEDDGRIQRRAKKTQKAVKQLARIESQIQRISKAPAYVNPYLAHLMR